MQSPFPLLRNGCASLVSMALVMLLACASATIDRKAVVGRHNVHFKHAEGAPIDPGETAFNVLTVGNGEFGFTADLTGLQSLNSSYHTPLYPLYTMSNWGWHTPSPATAAGGVWPFNSDGTLAYVYENVTIDSADSRPGKGNRTVPYQFNCGRYNNPALCNYLMNFPARVNLGQLSFVLPGADPLPPSGPVSGCSGLGGWCNTGTVRKDPKTGGYTCDNIIHVTPAASHVDATGVEMHADVTSASPCNETASCTSGWKNAPFCVLPQGQIRMMDVTPGQPNLGFFDGSCDRIQWNNTFDSSAWCLAGTSACAAAASHTSGGAAGPFRFARLDDIISADQTLDMWGNAQ